ncbi:MAG: hypothetical protein K9N35_01525 [Candidatus Marinimicrobia bacterium]|nr:hypothetical protein [Candidatus Neomarinimicrobiota bacterium]
MFLIVLVTVLACVIYGFLRPSSAAMLILVLVPLLGPGGFYFGVNTIFPVNAYRLGFFMLIGILFKRQTNVINIIATKRYTHIFIFYFTVLILLQVRHYPVPTLFTMIPFYTISLFLPFVLLRRFDDIYKIANVFVIHAVIISSFCLIEYYTSFSITAFIREYSGVNIEDLQTKGGIERFRGGFYRVAGLHGNSVQTAYHLLFLFPLTIFYLKYERSLIRIIPLSLVLVSLFLLQTRAAIIAVIATVIFIQFLLVKHYGIRPAILNAIKTTLILGIIFSFLLVFSDELSKIARTFISNIYESIFSSSQVNYGTQNDLYYKLNRLPIAFQIFLKHPLIGYLSSPRYAYYVLMRTDDVPSIVLNLLGGGVLLASLYAYAMVTSVYKTVKGIKLLDTRKQKDLVIYSGAAMFGGIFVTLSNWAEEHFLSIFLLYFILRYLREMILEKKSISSI